MPHDAAWDRQVLKAVGDAFPNGGNKKVNLADPLMNQFAFFLTFINPTVGTNILLARFLIWYMWISAKPASSLSTGPGWGEVREMLGPILRVSVSILHPHCLIHLTLDPAPNLNNSDNVDCAAWFIYNTGWDRESGSLLFRQSAQIKSHIKWMAIWIHDSFLHNGYINKTEYI